MKWGRKMVYYAHCMALYNTAQERLDIDELRRMGFEVENPNSHKHRVIVERMKAEGKTGSEIMDYFVTVVNKCDGIAFRAIAEEDNGIPAGVFKELQTMRKKGGFFLELPTFENRRVLSIAATANHIRMAKLQAHKA